MCNIQNQKKETHKMQIKISPHQNMVSLLYTGARDETMTTKMVNKPQTFIDF